MKIIALGGSGAMGRVALKTLLAEQAPDVLVVADIDLGAAERTASELARDGSVVTAAQIDVTDGAALRALLAEADLVMNSTGPFFRFGVPIVEAAIETGTTYVDICDDPEPTVDILGLNERAAAAGVAVIVGAGASPGFMNVMAGTIIRDLDTVEEVTSAWSFNSEEQDWDLLRSFRGGKSKAALLHFFQQASGTITATRGGALTQIEPMRPVEVDIPGLGTGFGYTVGHPEPITFPGSFGITDSSTSLCFMTGSRAAEFQSYLTQVDSGTLSLEDAVDWAMRRDPEVVAAAETAGADLPSVGTLPIYAVIVRGTKDGSPVLRFAGTRTKPEPMDIATGVPFAAAVLDVLDHQPAPGVHTPERVITPEPYFDRVARHWGVARQDLFFTGESSAVTV